jgi:hypothetical protein
MHIFRHIFLRNYWWQKSDIWSQASYMYPISCETFLDPSDSYFLFCDFVDLISIKINKIGKQEVGIWWVQKPFPRYGVPIWSLWSNIRFLPSIVAEKNATKNEHICSMLKHNDELLNIYYGIFYELWTFVDFDRLCILEKRGDEIKKKSSPLKLPIGSHVKLSSAVAAILVEVLKCRT